ncbi:protein piccolo-like isoform X1 [Eptesicus fuscus]|uniref:protein piccolo-like isoform X1 n=1 Tax=Eptesicus fuscus TaxID=29078 RepID=UPI00240404A2|nr:protein piccolo-like isoform X1 [Eptesicus fuscus]
MEQDYGSHQAGETGSAAAPGPLPAPVQGQGQGKCWCPAQATPTPTRANTPAPHTTFPPAAVARNTCNPDDLLGSIAKDLPRDLLRESGHPWSGLLESSKVVTFCQDKVIFGSQRLPTPGHPPTESPDHAPELEAARRPLPKQPETPAEKPLFYTFNLDSPTASPGRPGPPTPQRSRQEVRSQPEGQPLRARNSTCSRAPLSTCPATCLRQRPAPPPREATQRPASGAPPCQLQDPTEGHVLVFDMDTGNTRLGLLCQDPLGSRAVLVGLVPHHPSVHAPDNMPSTWPLAVPVASPNSNRSSFWPVSSVLSSPVPSSLSSGSYREVALAPKEAQLKLESRDGPGPETPIRVGLLPGPIPVGVPLQVGERTPSRVQDPGWSKPAAEKSEPTRTIWILDASRMQDASVVTSEPAPEPARPAPAQEAARAMLQADTGSHTRQEASTAHPNDLRAEGTRQGPLSGWPPLGEQHPVSGQRPAAGQPPSAEQPPLTGAPLARQRSVTGQPSFCQEPTVSKELILSRGAASTREAGQAPTLCQEGEALGPPAHVGVLRVPLAQEKTCVYVSRETMGLSVPPSSNSHWLSPWQPASSHGAPGQQLSLVTVATPGTSYKVLPMAMVGTAPRGPRLRLTAEDMTDSPVVTSLGLLSGAYYALPGQPPGLCGHAPGHFQSSAAVVIDTGSGFTKCGLAGEDHVLSVVPSRVQLLQPPAQDQPRYAMLGTGGGSSTVLNRGVVSDWDALEVLWQHLFYCKLGMRPEELAVLVADSPISPRTNREKVAEILFECFHVPAMQTVQQALLALYAYGRTTGLVLGSGHGTSYVAPVLTGDLAPLDTYRLDVAGADLTEYLAELLLAGGHSPPKAGLVNHIKETCCYVALDVKAEAARTQAQSPVDFVLPDKQVITLGSERFRCPEALFQPHLLGLNQLGLPQLALLSISRLEARQQEQLLANVVLDGGSTLVSGFPERLRQELGPRATVLGSPHRAVAAWLGGSIMASRDSFQSLWLSRREYEEEGPWAIYKYHL